MNGQYWKVNREWLIWTDKKKLFNFFLKNRFLAFHFAFVKCRSVERILEIVVWPTQNPNGEKSRRTNGDPGGIKFLFFSMKCERCIAHSFAKTANKYHNCDFRTMLCMKAKLS